MNNKFRAYHGSHENVMGTNVYVKFPTGFVEGKVIEYIFPKRGIIGHYKVRRADGQTMSTSIIYIKEEK